MNRKTLASGILLLFLVSMVSPLTGGWNVEETTIPLSSGPMDSPWPMYCHDRRHTSLSPYNTSQNPGIEKWRSFNEGWIQDCPAIDDSGNLYFGGAYDEISVYLVSINSQGNKNWHYGPLNNWVRGSSPAIADDGTVYFGSWDANFYALNPDGSLKWKTGVGGSVASSPVIADDGTIYVGTLSSGNHIVALNPNGAEKWRYKTGDLVFASPVIDDNGDIYCGSLDFYFYALYPDGSLKWKYETGEAILGSASIGQDGTIYVGSYDTYLYAFYPENGTRKWRTKIGYGSRTNPSIGPDDTIYIGGSDLYAIYPDGTLKWQFDPGPQRTIQHSSPAISAEGIIYFGTNIDETSGGEIFAVNSNGTLRWMKRIANDWIDSSPSIGSDGTVYIGSSSTKEKGSNNWYSVGYIHAFGEVTSNVPPEPPIISGKSQWKPGEIAGYAFTVHDDDNNPISLYIEWGDGEVIDWTVEHGSDERVYIGHTYVEEGTYMLRAKARDVMAEESDWATLEVKIPYTYHYPAWQWLCERFILLSRLLNLLL